MKTCVGYFYIDSVSGRHEADLYDGDKKGLFDINHFHNPKLTDVHMKFAVGKEACQELWEYRNEWTQPNWETSKLDVNF